MRGGCVPLALFEHRVVIEERSMRAPRASVADEGEACEVGLRRVL